ncbi:hypothetical protein AXA84_0395 [Candidatus Phytoplasma oryzae]|uniref:Uncharacterized protein n=2 Tax=Candidatus Phytoplasma oryzae TaxID=203274 RepID=A0A139JQD9_9MOLU|nr:hypothetical protein AXA84_0395 [Candidatus Phytoplasma oryzae]
MMDQNNKQKNVKELNSNKINKKNIKKIVLKYIHFLLGIILSFYVIISFVDLLQYDLLKNFISEKDYVFLVKKEMKMLLKISFIYSITCILYSLMVFAIFPSSQINLWKIKQHINYGKKEKYFIIINSMITYFMFLTLLFFIKYYINFFLNLFHKEEIKINKLFFFIIFVFVIIFNYLIDLLTYKSYCKFKKNNE